VGGAAAFFIGVEMRGKQDGMRPQKPDRGGDGKFFLAHDRLLAVSMLFFGILIKIIILSKNRLLLDKSFLLHIFNKK
jgi:hypothetical protein